jgi:ParB/RepB/Spo0J family partition protein
VNVRLDLIDRASDNPRRKPRDIGELAASIQEQGLLQPPVVVPGRVEGRYLLVAGHRRLSALRMLGWDSVEVVLREEMDDARRLSAMLTENDQRQPLTPMERAQAYNRLMVEFGLNQSQVARLVGKHPSTVHQSLQLLKPVEQRSREIDEYRTRREAGVSQRGRPPLEANVTDTMKALQRAADRFEGGSLTQAQAAVALRVIEQGAFALARERARDGRLAGAA